MKKLIAILMIAFMAVFAMAGDGVNDFKNSLGSSFVPANTDRIHFLDVSEFGTTGALGKEYVRWDWLVDQFVYNLTIDTNTVVADASATTDYITLYSGQLLYVHGVYAESGWDDTDFIEFNNADSNATTLDTLRLGYDTGTFHTNDWYFFATQDTVIYINLGDSVSVASTVDAFLVVSIYK